MNPTLFRYISTLRALALYSCSLLCRNGYIQDGLAFKTGQKEKEQGLKRVTKKINKLKKNQQPLHSVTSQASFQNCKEVQQWCGMFNFYDFKHHHSKFIALTSHSMVRPITSHYIHRQRAAKALHGNLHLFKRFVDIKTKKIITIFHFDLEQTAFTHLELKWSLHF